MHIRPAVKQDHDGIRKVHLAAFPENERAMIARLAIRLLTEPTTPETISLVAETDGVVVGHVAFSPVTMDAECTLHGYILAPLAVSPVHQKRGVGRLLIDGGIQRLAARGVDLLLVYGDPQYYGRFGFGAEAAVGFIPPYKLQYPFGWQALVLREDVGLPDSPVNIACVAALSDSSFW